MSMYEQSGRYYALFGPSATVTPEETRFLAHWAKGCHRALDFGGGLCGPASTLARLGLEVMAFEPSPILAALAMDRLNRGDDSERAITLVEGAPEEFAEPFAADLILMRSVLMLLDERQRAIALDAVARHAAPGARLIVDARTSALPWSRQPPLVEERHLGLTTYRRRTDYARLDDDATGVHWTIEAERFGRTHAVAEERFTVRADDVDGLRRLLSAHGFAVEQVHGGYDFDCPFGSDDAMIVVVACAKSSPG
jgi:hypothetical protein